MKHQCTDHTNIKCNYHFFVLLSNADAILMFILKVVSLERFELMTPQKTERNVAVVSEKSCITILYLYSSRPFVIHKLKCFTLPVLSILQSN